MLAQKTIFILIILPKVSGTKGNLGKQELNGKTRRSTSAIEITGDTRRNDSETTRVLRRSHTIANGKS